MKSFILSFLFLLSGAVLSAQGNTEPCNFDHYQRQHINSIAAAENNLQSYIHGNAIQSRSLHGVKTIPVVVHVIHTGGVENISDAQVQSQIDVLNEDFGKITGTNGDGDGVNCQIRFCLARLDPTGHCTNGIVRVQSDMSSHFTYQRRMLKQLSYWDNARYLNIYVVKSINGNSGIAGYSSFPGGPPDEDGFVVRYNFFGRTGVIAAGTNGRTATHEIGHWFGLYHTFNDSCGVDTCLGGDRVCDTPPAANPNYGCPMVNSCSIEYPDVNDQVANYMDYSDDACKSMFTAGQRDRMQGTLNTMRTVIWDGNNILATGCDSNFIPSPNCPPKASFVALSTSICTGGKVNFTSNSLNRPLAYDWLFPGGIPSSSTSSNPTVTYDAEGTYDVTLVVTNASGTDTLSMPGYIQVNIPVTGLPTSWGENFENGNFPANGITIDNPDNGITWERTMDAAREGMASARIQNLINTNYGQSDALVLPTLDLTTFAVPIKMAFRWAYARSDENYSDELLVLVSYDCGNTWSQKFYRTGSNLVTGPTQTTLFIPDSTQWKLASIDLTAYASSNHVDIKIVNVTDGGNALYIDSLKAGDFDFSTLPTSIGNIAQENSWLVYPNPAEGSIVVSAGRNQGQLISAIKVTNMLGKALLLKNDLHPSPAAIDISTLPKGIYLLEIKSENTFYQHKIIKQ